jgi:hypothetical protein
MNTQIQTSPLVGMYVTLGLMVLALGPMLVLVNSTPDQIPADIIAAEHAAAENKIAGDNVETKV